MKQGMMTLAAFAYLAIGTFGTFSESASKPGAAGALVSASVWFAAAMIISEIRKGR